MPSFPPLCKHLSQAPPDHRPAPHFDAPFPGAGGFLCKSSNTAGPCTDSRAGPGPAGDPVLPSGDSLPLSCTLSSPIPGALCAFFDFGRPDAIAFRSDADALPITERTGLPFASVHPGRMHACGHDGHMAMVLDLAVWLDQQTALPHNVLLLFQPAEETTGGAKDLCQSGVLEAHKVQCVFGMHLWPELPAGVIASRKREMMSRSCEVSVTITGRSSHIAKAEEGLDALAAGVEFYRRAAALEAALPPHLFRLLKFGRMESGTVRNAVSGKTVLLGSLRAFQDEVFLDLQQGLREIGQQVQADTGCQVVVHTNDGYPAVWNPDALYDRVKNLGLPFLELEKPVMISEDFSWYQRHLPALFSFWAAAPPRPFTRTTSPLTSPF
ncbi:MAG: amidohydrolase [Evtepia gabavorous]